MAVTLALNKVWNATKRPLELVATGAGAVGLGFVDGKIQLALYTGVVLGITDLLRARFPKIKGEDAPFIAWGIAVLLRWIFWDESLQEMFFYGTMIGLSAMGLWSGPKAISRKKAKKGVK